jgi:Phage capsid family
VDGALVAKKAGRVPAIIPAVGLVSRPMTPPAPTTRSEKPFLPSDLDPVRPLIRAVAASAIAAASGPGNSAAAAATRAWGRQSGNQVTLAIIERAASSPATTVTSGWAAEIAAQSVGAFIGSLSESAASRLISAAPRLSLDGINTLTLPRATSTGAAGWVAEGAAAPVVQAVIGGPTLGPVRKLVILESYTRELGEASPQDVEAIVGQVLRDAITSQLDVSLFSSTAASATRPAGIVAGIAALTAATGGGETAALADLRALADAVTAGGGGSDIALVTSPSRALAIRAYVPGITSTIWTSAHIPAGQIFAVSVGAFVSAFGTDVELRSSMETTVHFSDSPLQLASGAQGSAVVASPQMSAYQADLLVVKAVLRAAWAMRVPGAAQWISGATW